MNEARRHRRIAPVELEKPATETPTETVEAAPEALPVVLEAMEETPVAEAPPASAPGPMLVTAETKACRCDDTAGEEASAGDSLDALGELSGAVHDDLERAADLLERFGQCVPASACGVSGWRGIADAGADVSAVVLEGDQRAVSRDGGAGISLLLHVDLCDQRDFVCVVSADLGGVAVAGAGAAGRSGMRFR